MRVSIDATDHGYVKEARFRVWLDGIERRLVITADEERREALLFALDRNGEFVLEGDHLKTEKFYGSVVIRPMD